MLNIVSTPIGNLEDLSIRQAKTLTSADIMLAEDTRTAKTLLDTASKLFDLQITEDQKIISYYKEVEFLKLPQIIDWLKKGKNIALISEAGTPLISDPGYLLVKTALKENIPFTVIPGATAATTALLLSGFDPAKYMFLGFFPKKPSQLKKIINKIKQVKDIFPELCFIFYESPNRIHDTLHVLASELPNAQLAICREMTKKFEEVIRGNPQELLNKEYKGELTVVVQ